MPRPAKGPRLYLRRGRADSRTRRSLPDIYFIRDGTREISTGAGADRLGDAERALTAYLAEKHAPTAGPNLPADRRPRDPAQVLIADVLAYYSLDRAPALASPAGSVANSLKKVLAWWGDKTCGDVVRSNCKAYAAHRTAQPIASAKDPSNARRVDEQTARRELEDLSAAIGHWHGEYPFTSRPEVWLPEKRESPRDALTRSQAAALLWAAMGWRKGENGKWRRLGPTARTNRLHLRRFILIGLYTGTRHSAMRALLWEESATQAWVDLDGGMIYRRGRLERDQRTKRRPVVKLPSRLLAHMRRWREADQVRELALRERDPNAALVSVLHFGGGPILGKIRTGFAGCVRDAGLAPEVTPHWMRHTAATWLMEGGVDPWMAGGYLGMSPATLIKHYGHHRPDYQAEAAGALARRA